MEIIEPESPLREQTPAMNVPAFAELATGSSALAEPEPALDPLDLGGLEAPAIMEKAERPMLAELPRVVEPERQRRRVFGLFGGRKRVEPAPQIEPRMEPLRRSPFAREESEPQAGISTFALQGSQPIESPAPAAQQDQRNAADDLFSNSEERFEIPAFLRRQKTGS
jgi:hypothetical protein